MCKICIQNLNSSIILPNLFTCKTHEFAFKKMSTLSRDWTDKLVWGSKKKRKQSMSKQTHFTWCHQPFFHPLLIPSLLDISKGKKKQTVDGPNSRNNVTTIQPRTSSNNFKRLDWKLRSLYISGKPRTYPTTKPTFCPKWEVSVYIIGLVEG